MNCFLFCLLQAANEGSSDSYFVESNASSQSESDAEENEQQESAEDSSQSDQDNAQQQNNLHQVHTQCYS